MNHMATNSKALEDVSTSVFSDNTPQSIVYNPSLNSLIYFNDKNEFIIRNADQLSTLFHRSLSIRNHEDDCLEILSCHDKFLFVTSTHIYVRQLYQGL